MSDQELDFRDYYRYCRRDPHNLDHAEALTETRRRYHLDAEAIRILGVINGSEFA